MRSALDPAIERELGALEDALNGRTVTPEFAYVAMLVEAVRADSAPLPARLSARLERLPAAPSRRPRRLAFAGAGATTLAALIAVVLASGGSAPAPVRSARAVGSPDQSLKATAPGAAASPALAPAPPGPRYVQQAATLGLTAPHGKVQSVTDGVIAVTDSLGGIVENSSVTTGDQGADQAQLELQVPAARLQQALASLSRLAHVNSRTQQATDVTDSVGAARGRLTAARAERLALLRQLAGATTPNQVASIHAQLRLVAGQISQDGAQLASLLRSATYSGVSVSITEGQSAAGGGSPLDVAANDALDVLATSLAVALVALAALVPLLLVGGAAWQSASLVRRRRREATLDAQL
jgi:hypothetical protein